MREKVQSEAEVDFIHPYHGQLIPVEVKSGATGRLRSLHQFMDMAEHNVAIRFYSGNVQLDEIKTINNKAYYLLSLPYFLASQIEKYLDWMKTQIRELIFTGTSPALTLAFAGRLASGNML